MKKLENSNHKQDLHADYVRSILDHDISNGELVWRYRDDVPAWWNKRYAGKPAGSPDKYGYLRIFINGNRYLAHRLAWLHVHGEWPSIDIDHADNDPANNSAENLREATRSQNMYNRKLNNCSGASYHKSAGKWYSRVRVNGKRIHLGYFDTEEAASLAYAEAIKQHHKEFARVA